MFAFLMSLVAFFFFFNYYSIFYFFLFFFTKSTLILLARCIQKGPLYCKSHYIASFQTQYLQRMRSKYLSQDLGVWLIMRVKNAEKNIFINNTKLTCFSFGQPQCPQCQTIKHTIFAQFSL